MKVLFITNIPSPYRIDFFNEFGKYVDLKVVFEAKRVKGINFNWNDNKINNFDAIFLSEGYIKEKKINFKIFKYINKDEYDFIIFSNIAYYTELAAIFMAKLKRISYILELDGGIIKQENIFKYFFKRVVLCGAEYYFSPSKNTDEYLEKYKVDKNKIFRYPFTSIKKNEIISIKEKHKYKIQLKEKLNINYRKVIISVGQFTERKGHDILIKAFTNFDDDVCLCIIGGKKIEAYQKIIDACGIKNVFFFDFMSKEKLKEYFIISDLFVLATRFDIWGLVINEALAFGLPVITTNRCGAGLELIKSGNNGYLVDIEDIDGLHHKIEAIIKNDEKAKMMGNKSNHIIQEYTIENMAKIHYEHFKKISKGKKHDLL